LALSSFGLLLAGISESRANILMHQAVLEIEDAAHSQGQADAIGRFSLQEIDCDTSVEEQYNLKTAILAD
jgi:hypothetical protein